MVNTDLQRQDIEIYVDGGAHSIPLSDRILSRVSILTRDIDIAIMSVCPSVRPPVRDVPVLDENGLTYCNIFFTIR